MNNITLLDINNFIKQKGVLEITNPRLPSKNKFEPGSLWDPNIFGNVGSNARNKTFGYINLETNLIHPEAYSTVKSIDIRLSRILQSKEKYNFKEGNFIENNESGETGVMFLVTNFKNIDWEKLKNKQNKQKVDWVVKNMDKIIVNKYLVIPPGGVRDLDLSQKDATRTMSQINDLYRVLIMQKNDLSGIEEIDESIVENMQNQLIKINVWIKNNLKGKSGLLRGGMLKKSMDYSSRLVMNSSSKIPLGSVGIPWSTLISLYGPLFDYQVFEKDPSIIPKIKEFLQLSEEKELTYNNMNKFVTDVNANPELVDPDLKDHIKTLLENILSDKSQTVAMKRDPVENRNNWFSAHPIVIEGQAVVVNSLDLGPISGDNDGDTLQIVPLFTEDAKKQANENLNPTHAKSKNYDILSYGKTIYSPNHDAISLIFNATDMNYKPKSKKKE